MQLRLLLAFVLLAPGLHGADLPLAPQTVVSPLGRQMSLKFDDEFDGVVNKNGQRDIDHSQWQTTFWQGSSERTLLNNLEAQ